jgi:hypothetical protein
MQRSAFILTQVSVASLANFTGQTEMHRWQFTHFFESIWMTGANCAMIIASIGR